MRRASLIALLLLALAAGLAACGGGGSSSSTSSTTSSSTANPARSESTAWKHEVTDVMTEFENEVSSKMMPTIQDTYNKVLLEPLYRTYSKDLETLANKLDGTKPPSSCAAAHQRIGTAAHSLAKLTRELSEQSQHGEQWYSLYLERQGPKIQKASSELTELTFEPGC
jgi:hypothetical protein